MIELSAANLGIYVAQILVVVAIAAVAARLCDVPFPRLRLAYWRAVVVLSLALPFLALVQSPEGVSSTSITATPVASLASASGAIVETSTVAAAKPPISAYVVSIILAGMWVRGAWLVMGFMRLRHLRRDATPTVLDGDTEFLHDSIAANAEIRTCSHSRQPATFGFWRPVILLPDTVATMPAAERMAIVCHELIHVRRRDWVWTIAEEALRTTFWFHPAMRYAITQVQASREEVVDAEVIARSGNRGEYIRALLAFAEMPAVVTAAAFVRQSQLSTRLRRMTEEIHMSRLRLQVTVATLAVVLLSAIALAGAGLHYDVSAQQPDAPAPPSAVQFSMPLSRAIVRLDRPVYPPEAWQAGIGAEVSLLVTVSANGSTTVQSDPAWRVTVSSTSPADAVQSFWARQGWRDFIESVNEAVRQWQYVPADSDVTVAARVSFQPPSPSVSRYRLGMATYFEQGSTLERLLIVRELGEMIAERYRAAAVIPPNVVDLQALLTVGSQAPLRVGGDVREPQRVYGFPPVYPEIAKAARVQGDVVLEVLIGVDGAVQDLRVLRSIPLLDQAALDTVRTWVFSTTLVDGVPREVITNVTVNFTLPDQQ